jgi:hypothetical protein
MTPAAQPDLFGTPHAAGFPPDRGAEWDAVLRSTIASGTLWIHASANWQGVVAETLTAPDLGSRFILWIGRKFGPITEYPALASAIGHRTVFMPPSALPALHRRLPLVRIDWGPGWARFRPAEDGEPAAETVEISAMEGVPS